jgi:hypothetical protein
VDDEEAEVKPEVVFSEELEELDDAAVAAVEEVRLAEVDEVV